MTANKDFAASAAPLEKMDAEAYRQLLEKLVTQGTGFGKTADVGAFLLQDLFVRTETILGEKEVDKMVSVEKLYLCMDLSQYPLEKTRGQVVKDMAANWGARIISEREMDSPDFSGPGIWLLKKSSFEGDYKKKNSEDKKDSLFTPDLDAYRICLDIEQDVKIPFMWDPDGFTIRKGGTLAIRERDLPTLVAALESIRSGEKTAEQSLLKMDEKSGKTVAIFDIYGMEPFFLRGDGDKRKANYNDVTLKDVTKAMQSAFAKVMKAVSNVLKGPGSR